MNIFKRKHSLKECNKILDDAMANAERINKRLEVLENEFDKRGELIAIQKEIIADQEKQISVLIGIINDA